MLQSLQKISLENLKTYFYKIKLKKMLYRQKIDNIK